MTSQEARVIGSIQPGCLNIGMNLFIPYMNYSPPPVDKYYGPSVELMEILAKELKFCYYITHYSRISTGLMYENGTWSFGTIRKILEKEFDFLSTPVSLNYDRYKAIDVSHYMNIDEHVILSKYPTISSDYTGFLKPYSSQVWISLCAMFLFYPVILWQMSKVQTKIITVNSWDFARTVVFTFKTMIGQDLPTNMNFSRFLVGLWLLCALTMTTVYKGNLKAALIAPIVQIPFRNLEDLSYYEDVTPMMVEHTYLQSVALASDPDSTMGRIIKRTEYEIRARIVIKKVMTGDYAFIVQRDTLLNVVHSVFGSIGSCGLTVTKPEGILPVTLGLAFQKNSKWKPKVDKIITRLVESGIMQKLIDDYNINATYCLNPERQVVTLEPLKLSDIYGVLMLFLGGVFLAAVSFIGELIIGKINKIYLYLPACIVGIMMNHDN